MDHEVILAITEKLDGKECGTETLEEIADLLRANGYPVRDAADAEIAYWMHTL